MLGEQQPAARRQHAPHLAQRRQRIGISAQRVGADHRVEGRVRQRQTLRRDADDLHRQPRRAAALQRQAMHAQRRLHADQLAHATRVVEGQVQPGADADLQHPPLRLRDDLHALLAHRLHAAGEVDQPGQDVAFVPVAVHA
ncbi:MAG: hypothetical protein M5R42_11840 [Rhodocyclaceae bacterium]|nr:hypothetical protein [Rhodocyclaceae bacterium]